MIGMSLRGQVALERSVHRLGNERLLNELTQEREIARLQRLVEEQSALIQSLRAEVELLRSENGVLAREIVNWRVRCGYPLGEVPSPEALDKVKPSNPCPDLGISCHAGTDWKCPHFNWQTCPQKLNPEFVYLRCPGQKSPRRGAWG